jgi:hypothetical protein
MIVTESGNGTLNISSFSLDAKVTSYDIFSAFIIDPYVDYGFIDDSELESDDYGFIIDSTESEDDYGSVSPPFIESTYPFGTIDVFGESVETLNKNYVGLGTLTLSGTGTLVSSAIYLYNGSGEISVYVDTGESHTESYVGSGFFSALSGSVESFGSNPPDRTVDI